jgi:hypothetical protein
MNYLIDRIDTMSVEQRQRRYRDLSMRVAELMVLSREELSEMILLRDSLQRTALLRQTPQKQTS